MKAPGGDMRTWRRGWDSNPRYLAAQRFSRPSQSTTLAPLREVVAQPAAGPVDRRRALADAFGLAKALACLGGASPYIGYMTDPNSFPAVDRSEMVAAALLAPDVSHARFAIGDVVRHRMFDFRGVIFDVDPVFANSEEWYDSIPAEIRPSKEQPFYHLLAENGESSYVAYVSQQNLLVDDSEEPVDHPAISGIFDDFAEGRYRLRREHRH
jgi:heat shock protein HspQ